MNGLQANLQGTIEKATKNLKFEITQDNQKYFQKEIKRLQQKGLGGGGSQAKQVIVVQQGESIPGGISR